VDKVPFKGNERENLNEEGSKREETYTTADAVEFVRRGACMVALAPDGS